MRSPRHHDRPPQHGSLSWSCVCRSAHLISRYRPRAPIIAVTRSGQTARQAHLYRGIFPVLYNKPAHNVWAEDVDLRVNFAMEMGEAPWRRGGVLQANGNAIASNTDHVVYADSGHL